MIFKITKTDNYTILSLTIEKLDNAASPELKSELVLLNASGVKNIILDLSESRYCDSSGLSAILVGNRLCKNANGSFIICNIQEPVKKLITISQLDSILNIKNSLSEAIALF